MTSLRIPIAHGSSGLPVPGEEVDEAVGRVVVEAEPEDVVGRRVGGAGDRAWSYSVRASFDPEAIRSRVVMVARAVTGRAGDDTEPSLDRATGTRIH